MAKIGLIYRQEFLLHRQSEGHPERPARLQAVMEGVEDAAIRPVRLDPASATRADLLRIHNDEHIAAIERTCADRLRYPDPDTQMVPESWQAALLAAGSGITACQAVLDDQADHVFCAVRPPGHHAEADRAMGFCLFNNIAIAAKWLRVEAGLRRVAIVDWDVHHGNGTQHSFYDDDSVYYFSLHQHPLYPGTGMEDERGKNRTNLNIHMDWGHGSEEWLEAVQSKVLPELERFDPDFLLISAGFDAHKLDPLGAQRVDGAAFGEMTRLLKGTASGKLVSMLEGGYSLDGLRESVASHLVALAE
jgi:acetoin utilization deacetylase AcuC-like enzyme